MISVILPSVRPENLQLCIKHIIDASIALDVELILVLDQKYGRVVADIKSKIIITKRNGVIDALNKGIDASRGDYLFTLSDEALLGHKAFMHLEQMCKEYNNRILLSPASIPYYPFYYYGKYFAPFPFIHRDLMNDVDGFFDPIYKSFYADPDLSLRVHAIGVPVKECGDAKIVHINKMDCPKHQHNVNLYANNDREIFKKRWAHLGEFGDP